MTTAAASLRDMAARFPEQPSPAVSMTPPEAHGLIGRPSGTSSAVFVR